MFDATLEKSGALEAHMVTGQLPLRAGTGSTDTIYIAIAWQQIKNIKWRWILLKDFLKPQDSMIMINTVIIETKTGATHSASGLNNDRPTVNQTFALGRI